MKKSRHGGCVIALALVASVSNTIGFSARAADLAPIIDGGGYFNWSGLYAGGNFGGGVGRTSFVVTAPDLMTSTSDEIRGFVGGGQAGFNWQFGPVVAGVEGDLQFSHQQNGVVVSGLQISNLTDMIGTLRGRVGLAMEDWLFYATAGGGYLHNNANLNLAGFGGLQESDLSPVWVVGAGVETRVTGRWTARLEYLYLSSGSITSSLGFPAGTLAVSKTINDNVIRTGLSYYF